jgi:hypothetical protein
MAAQRAIRAMLARPGQNQGLSPEPADAQTLNYDGRRRVLKF